MNEQEKKTYLDGYKSAKERGVPFFPDIIFKDTIIVLLVFILLASLAYFVGAPVEERANPNDTNYTPRPEWYFLFLFQLLKYFPGNLEVLGAMVFPTLFILLLVVLPFIDKSPKRHFFSRPFATLGATLVVIGIGALTVLSVLEAPPPAEAVVIDHSAKLYADNCANCHGPSIEVQAGTDLHQVIAAGTHEGMPAWGGDLSVDEIDALAGFITSPRGSAIYIRECETCHEQMILAVGNPIELKRVLEAGPNYTAHKDLAVPLWDETLPLDERNALLNFLAAPDGQRLFALNCAGCHGQGVAFGGTEEALGELITKGGQHLEMPAWKGTLNENDLDVLSSYVVDPKSVPDGDTLFGQHCASCHGDSVPHAPDKASARKIISSGGSHITMPVWGDVLTIEQLDSLVQYTLEASKGVGAVAGERIFQANCSACHGQFGEGGPNPARPDDVIAPISSSEYLATRDDATLRNIISQGQPNFGMSPFGSASGGPLSDEEISEVVAFIRSWEANPPVEFPPEIISKPEGEVETHPALSGAQIFASVCSRCHGEKGEGDIGPGFNTQDFQDRYDDQAMFDVISTGHEATAMVAWGEILTSDQIQQLVQFIRSIKPETSGTNSSSDVSFSADVVPIFEAKCKTCHSTKTKLGGWDSSSYESVTTSGDNAPVIIPEDSINSLLAQLLQGVSGDTMPPRGKLPDEEIQIILDWIQAGALDN